MADQDIFLSPLTSRDLPNVRELHVCRAIFFLYMLLNFILFLF
jgi:hypothetical protein